MILKLLKNNSALIIKMLSVVLFLAILTGIIPNGESLGIRGLSATAEGLLFYDSTLGEYSEENGMLTASPYENCGFRGWYSSDGEEVSVEESFVIPEGKTADDYFPVFYNFNIFENGGFEDSSVGEADDSWFTVSDTDSIGSFTVSNAFANNGANSLEISASNMTAYRRIEGLEQNSQYTLRFYYKHQNCLSFVSVVDDGIELDSKANSIGGGYISKKSSAELAENFVSDDWNMVSLTFFTENITSLKLCLFYADNETPLYIDDISIIRDTMSAPSYFSEDFESNGIDNTEFTDNNWNLNVQNSASASVIKGKKFNTLKMVNNSAVCYATELTTEKNKDYRITFDYYAPTLGAYGDYTTVFSSVGVAPKNGGELIFRTHTTTSPAGILTVAAPYSWAGAYDAADRMNNSKINTSVDNVSTNGRYTLYFDFNSGNNDSVEFYINPVTIGNGADTYFEISNFRIQDLTTNIVYDEGFLDSNAWTALNSSNNIVTWAVPEVSAITDNNGFLKVSPSKLTSVIHSRPIFFKKRSEYTFTADIDISEFRYNYVPLLDDGNYVLDKNGCLVYQKIENTTTNLVNWINFSFSSKENTFGSAASNTLIMNNGGTNALKLTVTDSKGKTVLSKGSTYSATGFGIGNLGLNTNCSELTVQITFTSEITGVGYFNIRMNGYETYYIDSLSLEENNESTDRASVMSYSALKTVGTAIRTEGNQGIRHKTSVDKRLLTSDMYYGIRLTEYGTIAIKTAYLSGSDLTLDGMYDYNNTLYAPQKGVAYSFADSIDKIYYEDNSTIHFTGVLINIAKQNWNTDYTVRAYFKYVDSSGNENVIYIDSSDVAVYPVSKVAYSAKNLNGEYTENEQVRNYLYNNIITAFADKTVRVSDNSEPIYTNFQGIRSTVYHGVAFFPDSHGRTYTDTQAAIEMDRLVDSKVDNVRTRFDSHWMWTADGWDWGSTKMAALYKWAKMLQDRDISITLNLGWSIRDFIYYYDYNKNNNANNYEWAASNPGHSSIPEVDYLHGVGEDIYGEDAKAAEIAAYPNLDLTSDEKAHYSVVATRYAEWGSQALNAFRANGINNVEYIIPFTENGYSRESKGDYTFCYDEWMMFTMALHDILKEDGVRNDYKIIGPCQSIYAYENRKTPFLEYIYRNISGTEYADMLDINAMHQYTRPNTSAGYENTVYDPKASYSLAEENFPYYQQILDNAGISDMEFWCDEYFAYANDARWWDNVGMQMTQFAAGLTAGINNGVNRFLIWQMFDCLWDSEATHGVAHLYENKIVEEFIGGVHAVGTCPSLVKANGETCKKENCPCKNYTDFSSYTPRVTYYGINLLGRYLNNNNAQVYSTQVLNKDDGFDGGVYVSAIKNDDGKTVVLVVNTMDTTSSVDVCFEKSDILGFDRYVYNPNEVVPTMDSKPIESDKSISLKGEQSFYDVVPAESFAIYVQNGTYLGNDFDISMDEE